MLDSGRLDCWEHRDEPLGCHGKWRGWSVEWSQLVVQPVRIIAAGTGCLFGVMARATGCVLEAPLLCVLQALLFVCLLVDLCLSLRYQSTCRIMLVCHHIPSTRRLLTCWHVLQYVSVYCCVAISLIVCTVLDVKDHTKLVSDAAEGQVCQLRQLCAVGRTNSGLAGVVSVPRVPH